MPKINLYLPQEVYDAWENDLQAEGLIAGLVAEHYGFEINKSRVVKKPTVS